MSQKTTRLTARMAVIIISALLSSTAVKANPSLEISNDTMNGHSEHAHHNHHNHSSTHDHTHTQAPIGVMGGHMHEKGDWMISYRYMQMTMRGSRDGTDSIDPLTIATTVPNPTGAPPTFRVVPTDMTMQMHMFSGMYGFTDWLTGMVMVNYLQKDMDHVTFQNGAGTTVKGTFTTESEGFGDTKLTGLVRLYEDGKHHVHINAGISLPTGSITEDDEVLPPPAAAGLTRLRLPYAMQLGTGTYDLLPGITYTAHQNEWNWGAQYSAEIRLESENDEGYAYGDLHKISAWAGYDWTNWFSTSLRVTASTQGKIDGSDDQIAAPVQTADPDNYGGDIVEAGLGIDFKIPKGFLKDQRIAFEGIVPVYRDLNGPQLETDFTFVGGFQYSF